jgi:E3 ubiquitin-protein ligase BOI-like protein
VTIDRSLAMAVEAHHLLHTAGGAGAQRQLLTHAGWAWAGDAAAAACYEAPPARQQGHQRSPCCYGGGRQVVAAARPTTGQQQVFQQSCVANQVPAAGRPTTGQQQVFQQSCAANQAPAPAGHQLVMPGQYAAAGPRMCAADASESGVTFGGGIGAQAQQQQEVMMTAPRNKRKRADLGQTSPVLGLGAAEVAAHFQQQLADVDRLVLQHVSSSRPITVRCVLLRRARPAAGFCVVVRVV